MGRALGHYAPRLLIALVAVLVTLTVVPIIPEEVFWQVLLGLLVLGAVLAASIFSHNGRLCERCIAALPLEASAMAGRRKLQFRVAHLFERKVFAGAYLL